MFLLGRARNENNFFLHRYKDTFAISVLLPYLGRKRGREKKPRQKNLVLSNSLFCSKSLKENLVYTYIHSKNFNINIFLINWWIHHAPHLQYIHVLEYWKSVPLLYLLTIQKYEFYASWNDVVKYIKFCHNFGIWKPMYVCGFFSILCSFIFFL